MTDRATFLTRIGEALGRRPRDPVAPPPSLDEGCVRRVSADDPLLERFVAEVLAVGGEILRGPAAVLPATIAARLSSLGIHDVVLDEGAMRLGIGEACEREGLRRHPLDSAPEDAAGITTVRGAIAETGSVILDAARGSPRGVSLLPRTHVAVVLEAQLVPDLCDALALPGPTPSARVWVTGPSKTADIEGVLVTGVHGPGRWIVAVAEGR